MAMLRASWFCSQGSLLVRLWGLNSVLAICKASALPIVLSCWPVLLRESRVGEMALRQITEKDRGSRQNLADILSLARPD